MIAGVVYYCCLCALVLNVCRCQHRRDISDNDGYSNDSPFISDDVNLQTIRIKTGTPSLTLKCGNGHQNSGVIWEYKPCPSYYNGLFCNANNKIDNKSWIKVNRPTRQKIEINFPNGTHNGLYRCRENEMVKKTYLLEVVDNAIFNGPPPTISSMKISNATNELGTEFTIQCNVTSVVPPSIIWFKSCFGYKCEIQHDNVCYCHLNLPPSVYNTGPTYLSKIKIYNTRLVDSGIYVCLAVTEYGKDHKNVTVKVPNATPVVDKVLFPLIFFVCIALVLISGLTVLYCYKRKKKTIGIETIEQRQHLTETEAMPVRNINHKRR